MLDSHDNYYHLLSKVRFSIVCLIATRSSLDMASFSVSNLEFDIPFLRTLSLKPLGNLWSLKPLGHLWSLQRLSIATFLLIAVCYTVSSYLAWFRLRKFPAASWLANFSYLWLAKTTYSGKQYWVHRGLHQKHKLLRIGPNELLTDDPDIVRKISSARSGYNRDSWYITGRFNPYHDNMFTVLQSNAHTKFKSRTLHAYSGREIPDLEIGVNQQVATLLRVMRDNYARKGRLLDLGQLSCYFTMDVITRLAFGNEFGYLATETDRYSFLKGVRDLWPQMSTSADIPWIRNILFSNAFLRLLGPTPKDKNGFGALMA